MRLRIAFLFLPLSIVGCADVLGLPSYEASGGAGATGGGGTGGDPTGTGGAPTGGSGGTGGASTGGAGGAPTGGAGGEGGTATRTGCVEGETEPCYEGPPGTEGIGLCKAGTRTCDTATGELGACEGQILPALESCATPAVDESCDQIAACTGQYRWARLVGGSGAQTLGDVAVDPNDASLVVAGATGGPVDFGGGELPSFGNNDLFVAKLAPGGQHVWSRIVGEPGTPQVATGVAVDAAGNLVVVGRFGGNLDFGGAASALVAQAAHDGFVVKLDPAGNAIWSTAIGDPSGNVGLAAVALDAAGDVYVTGHYNGSLTVGATPALPASSDGAENILVARLDGATGAPVWAKGFGGIQAQSGRAIAVDGAGDLWVAANAAGPLDFGLGFLGEGGAGDVALARLGAADGTTMLSKRYGDDAEQLVGAIAPAVGAGIVVAAQVRGQVNLEGFPTMGDTTMDVLVFELKTGGTVAWAKRAGAPNSGQIAHGLAVEPSGNVVLSGFFSGGLDFSFGAGGALTAMSGTDRFVVKLGPDGSHLWSRQFLNAAMSSPTRVAVDGLGRIDFLAELVGETDFGGGPLASFQGTRDVVIGQLAP